MYSAPSDLQADILYEDNHLIAVNKRPGDIVQGDKSGDVALLDVVREYIRVKYNKPGEAYAGLIHRLDRPVSGVVLFARTSKSLARMNKLIRERSIEKTYWAITQQLPDPPLDRLQHWMVKDEAKNKSFVIRSSRPGAKEAILDYRLLGVGERYAFVEVLLHSGRHHQIRVQLSHIGCPIKGDLKYGAERSNPDGSLSLHARSLKFIHPVHQNEMHIIAPPPEDRLWKAFSEIASQGGPA
jgi:23S rRNA pseudouridine1911/1915/1917 synthase